MDKRRALAGAAIALAAFWLTRRSSGPSGLVGPSPERVGGVPFAVGSATPAWPVLTSSIERFSVGYKDTSGATHGNQSRAFGAKREGSSRRHAGVDLYGREGDIVVAAESGVVAAVDKDWHLGTGMLYLFTDTGITLAYGEVKPGGWNEFGVGPGTRVARGQKIGRIGCMRRADDGGCDSNMLHFEIYQGRQTKNHPWYPNDGVPPELLNPTQYLMLARRASGYS